MEASEFEARVTALEKENRILKQKLARSEANRVMLEEALETHSFALKVRNKELEESQIQIQQSEAKYRNLAFHDILTGLPNRTMFQEQLGSAIVYAQNSRTSFALFFIDLDKFKPVNDNWGHDAGDSALREIAGRLRICVRGDDVIARIGGDEFAVLMKNLKQPQDAAVLADRIVGIINKPILLEDQSCSIGASIGISCYPSDGERVDLLLQKADAAMYSIKKTGFSGYRFYEDLTTKP